MARWPCLSHHVCPHLPLHRYRSRKGGLRRAEGGPGRETRLHHIALGPSSQHPTLIDPAAGVRVANGGRGNWMSFWPCGLPASACLGLSLATLRVFKVLQHQDTRPGLYYPKGASNSTTVILGKVTECLRSIYELPVQCGSPKPRCRS